MKATITCDDVFDVLTRGPFPTGSSDDEAVELHLTGCHECRRLAEALRPAVELFHEVLDEKQSGLPVYRGRLTDLPPLNLPPPQRVWWEEEQLLDLPVQRRPARSPSGWGLQTEAAASLVRFASAALLGVALCLLVWTCSSIVARQPANWQASSAAKYSAGPLRLGKRTTIALAALKMADACRGTAADSLPAEASVPAPATANAADQACCTKCHAAAHPRGEQCLAQWSAGCESCHLAGKPARMATQHVSLQQQTCQVCHDG